jgi:hypothetical protein
MATKDSAVSTPTAVDQDAAAAAAKATADAADKVAADAAAATKAAANAAAAKAAAETAECAASQHLWGLPEKNPFNSSSLDCSFACKRCGVSAKFTIAVGK